MDYILGIVGIILLFFGYEKYKQGKVDALLGLTKEKDSKLIEKQKVLKSKIESIDKQIKDIEDSHKKAKEERLSKTDKERAEEWD